MCGPLTWNVGYREIFVIRNENVCERNCLLDMNPNTINLDLPLIIYTDYILPFFIDFKERKKLLYVTCIEMKTVNV